MKRDILKSMLCDKLEKAVSNKYVRKEPDGKGGFRYIYTEKERESTNQVINRSGDKSIEKTGTNPAAVTKGLKAWLNKNNIDYDYNKAKTTASSYFKFETGKGSYEIRVSNHTKANANDKGGIDIQLYDLNDGFSVDIDTAYGFTSKDIQNIIKDAERINGEVHKNEKLKKMLEDETLLERYYNERYIPSKHTKFIEDVVNSIGIEESEFGILGDIVNNMFDQSLHKSGVYKKMVEEREKKIQEQKEKEAKEKESKKERRDRVMEELNNHIFKQENSTTPPEEFEKIVQERSNGRAKGFTVIGELGEGDRKKYFYEWAYPVPEGKKNYTKPSDKFVYNYLKSKDE